LVEHLKHPLYNWIPDNSNVGQHKITLVATKGGLSYSGDFNFVVKSVTEEAFSIVYSTYGCDSGTAPVDEATYITGSQPHVLDNTGNLTKTQDGINLRFTGWGTTKDPVNGETLYTPGSILVINGDIVLYPRWTAIGCVGPAGGWVFYDKGTITNNWRYLEASPVDLSKGVIWADGYTIVNGTLNDLDASIPNTEKILVATSSQATNAARLCSEYSIRGYADWALPSPVQLQYIYNNLHNKTPSIGNFNVGITQNAYWSSQSYDEVIYWPFVVQFTNGATLTSYRQFWNTLGVRAVRAFKSGNPTYTITYDANGGTGSVPLDIAGYEEGDTVTVRGNTGNLAKPGYTNLSWNTEAGGAGDIYVLGTGTFTMPAENVTLYAIYN